MLSDTASRLICSDLTEELHLFPQSGQHDCLIERISPKRHSNLIHISLSSRQGFRIKRSGEYIDHRRTDHRYIIHDLYFLLLF